MLPDSYNLFDFGFTPKRPLSRQFNNLSREDARRLFDRIVSQSDRRLDVLTRLGMRFGFTTECENTALSVLGDWFIENLEPRSKSNFLDMSVEWYSIALDICLLVGQCIQDEAPNLKWDLCTSPPDDADYHMPVLYGFSSVENKNFHYNILAGIVSTSYLELLLRNPEDAMEGARTTGEKVGYQTQYQRWRGREDEHSTDFLIDMKKSCLKYA